MTNSVYPLATSSWGTEEVDAINEVVASGRFTMGEKVAKFEQEFADYFGSRPAPCRCKCCPSNIFVTNPVTG